MRRVRRRGRRGAVEGEEDIEGQTARPEVNPERHAARAAHRGVVTQTYQRVAREARWFIA